MLGFLFTWFCVAVGVVRGWADPALGATIYFLFAILRPEQLWFWSFDRNVSNNFSLMIGASTLIGWLLVGLGDTAALRRIWLPVTGLTVMLVWGLMSTVGWARYPDPAWTAMDLQFKFWLLALVVLTTVRTEKQIKAFAWMIVLSMGYLAFVFNEHWVFEGYNRALRRPLHGDNNNLALVMVVGTPIAFFMGMYVRNIILKCVTFFALACMNHLVLFSFSRGGMLGLVIVGLGIFMVMLVKMPRKMLTVTVFSAAVAGTIILAGAEVRQEFWSAFADPEVRDSSAQSRVDMAKVGLRVLKENPAGLGPRNLPPQMDQYGWNRGKLLHNAYLQIGCDWGVPGLAGWLAFYFGAFVLTFKTSMSAVAQRLGWPVYFGRMVCISLLGYFASATFLSCEKIEPPGIIALLGLCTVAHCKRVEEEEGLLPALTDEQVSIPELEQVPPPSPDPSGVTEPAA